MVLPRGAGAPLLVREATRDDAAAIGEVHAEAWRVAHRDLFDARWLPKLVEQRRHGWTDIMEGRQHARNTLLLAEQGDRVVAFTYFGPHSDGMPDAEILDLYAHPAAWGTGVAWTLMDAAWDHLREARFRRVKAWTMAASLTAHLAPDAIVKGRSIDWNTGFSATLFQDAEALPVAADNTWKLTSSVEIPVAGGGKIPVSIIYTNDPNALVKQNYVGGQIGLSYDFSALKAILKK